MAEARVGNSAPGPAPPPEEVSPERNMQTAALPVDLLETEEPEDLTPKRWVLTSDMTGTPAPPEVKRRASGVEASSVTGKEMTTGSQEDPLRATSAPEEADFRTFTVPGRRIHKIFETKI